MASIHIDPTQPLTVSLSFDSPQAVSYVVWKKAKGASWETVAHGTDEEGVTVSGHSHEIDPVTDGMSVKYRLIFAGNPNSAIKAAISFKQNNVVLKGSVCSENGSVDGDGVAVRSKEMMFDA